MIIMGIDPGTASMGYGIIKIDGNRAILKEHGVVRTKPGVTMPKRLGVLYSHLDDVTRKFKPDVVSIEKLFFNTNSKTAMSVGQARGISMLVAAHNNVVVVEYTALQAKKILSGYGRASKKEMQDAVKKHLGISTTIKPDDANDGVAMALCHFKLGFMKK